MKIARVTLVNKRSQVDRLAEDASPEGERLRQLVEAYDPSVRPMVDSHAEHIESVRSVRETLRRHGVEVDERNWLPREPIKDVDLIIAVGGDGMVLGVSHWVHTDIPLLGVNSAPSVSVGYLAGCTADGLGAVLEELRAGTLGPRTVQRLQVQVGERIVPEPVLNDALFCTNNPAIMCRYLLEWPDGEEHQRSSGVWVATPAGSTCALSSAGGPVLPLTARQFAFLVREPYCPPGREAVRLRSAVLDHRQTLRLECRVNDASVFLDGSHRQYGIAYGEVVSFRLHPEPLRLIRPASERAEAASHG